jgi:hypothetical protein
MFWTKRGFAILSYWRYTLILSMVQAIASFITSRAKSHVQFLLSCYDVELLATRQTNKLKDTPYGISATACSVFYQLPSIFKDHLLHRNVREGHTVMTRKHLVQLMIHSNYHDSFYHRLAFLVALTVLLKKFTLQIYLTSIINVLLLLSIIDLVLILSLLLNSFWPSVSIWLLRTSLHEE